VEALIFPIACLIYLCFLYLVAKISERYSPLVGIGVVLLLLAAAKCLL